MATTAAKGFGWTALAAQLFGTRPKSAQGLGISAKRYHYPVHGSLLTPAYYATKRGGGLHVRVDLPNSCFPDYRADGKPSTMTVLKPDHPLAAGLGKKFTIEHTEMYNEPFHVPDPDEVVFEETWASGERFRSGMVWQLGKGRVIYFRPGHETFPVFKQPEPLRFLENTVRWLGEKT